MNDTLEKALATIINNTTNAVGAGISFLSEQIPDVVRQLLLWEATKNSVIASVWVVCAIVSFIIAHKLRSHGKTYVATHNHDDEGFFSKAFGLVFMIVGSSFILISITFWLNVLKILIAPKIFLITYAATLIKGN